MMLIPLLMICASSPLMPMDESATIALVRQAVATAGGASENAQMDTIRKLREGLFGVEVSVSSADVIGVGKKKVTHPAWLIWGINDLLTDLNETQVESDYRKLGFAFSGEQMDGGVVRMLKNQQEVVCVKEYDGLYVSYAVLFAAKDAAKLKVGGKVSFTFRMSALRVFKEGVEMRGVAASVGLGVKKSQ